MTSKWLDISLPLDSRLPTWPESPGASTSYLQSIEGGDSANVTQLTMDVHTGTHIDAPRHFIGDGATVDEIGLEPFVGEALVLDVGGATTITADVLDAAAIPAGTERLLLRTDNSAAEIASNFDEDYAALSPDGAEYLVDRLDLKLIGIDYLSIQRYSDPPDAHLALLGAGGAILEGLSLRGVAPGTYELVCLPLRLVGVEGAPARAILLPTDGGRS